MYISTNYCFFQTISPIYYPVFLNIFKFKSRIGNFLTELGISYIPLVSVKLLHIPLYHYFPQNHKHRHQNNTYIPSIKIVPLSHTKQNDKNTDLQCRNTVRYPCIIHSFHIIKRLIDTLHRT